jgi:hypothetical protein
MQELYFLFSDFVNVGHSRTLQVQKLSGRQVFKKVKKFKIGGVKENELLLRNKKEIDNTATDYIRPHTFCAK